MGTRRLWSAVGSTRASPDPKAAKHRQLRVIDESGEDYVYPENFLFSLIYRNSEVCGTTEILP